jgi:hypothetical protein
MSSRIKILLWVYLTGGLLTFLFQVGIRLTVCVGRDTCLLSLAKAPVWSLFWPFSWAVLATGLAFRAILLGVLFLLSLCVIGEGLYRLFALINTESRVDLDGPPQYAWPAELVIGACALTALLAAEWILSSVSHDLNYGIGDGKMAQAVIYTALKFGGWLQVTNINPLQGIGSQLLTLNAWANPAYWSFAVLGSPWAPNVSGVTALACFAVACYVMARCFDLPALPSVIAAQLCMLLFVPAVEIFEFLSVFFINPGQAVVYAPHMLALGLLARLQPGRVRDFILLAGGVFLLLLYSLYCDPLWTMISGISWSVAFAVVALSPLNGRGIFVRLGALGGCAALLLLSGALEYVYTLSQYTARVQFSDLLHRVPSPHLASLLFAKPVAVHYYGVCLLGWILGFLILRGRPRTIAVAGFVTFAFFLAYAAAFLLLPGHWWLPLPIYVEHCLFPLFTTSAVAGYWSATRVAMTSTALARKKRESECPAEISTARSRLVSQLANAIRLRPVAHIGRGVSLTAPLFIVAFVPAASLSLLDRARMVAETSVQPLPDEPELARFFTKRIGLEVGGAFRGSLAYWTGREDDLLSMTALWMRSIPTANEYSQLVTPQALYLNSVLFKKDVKYDLNQFMPWVGTGSYEVLFKTLQALGVRYIAGYEPFPEAEERHFTSSRLPRRSSSGQTRNWQIYELPEPNLGHYSPIEVTVKETGAEIVATISGANFDFKRQAVLWTDTEPLVPARNMRLSLIRGGLHLSGRSDSTSLVVLPQQFSNCLRARDSRVRLVRVNLMMTGMIFSGEVDTDISFGYGIFTPACRRADLADTRRLDLRLDQRMTPLSGTR